MGKMTICGNTAEVRAVIQDHSRSGDPDGPDCSSLNCTLKRGGATSSTDKLLQEVLEELKPHGVTGQIVRVVDLDIKAGVSSDEGDGDDWPELRRKILGADIIILGTPIWLGQPSSVAKRVLERMDAFLEETDDRGRMPPFGRLRRGRGRQ